MRYIFFHMFIFLALVAAPPVLFGGGYDFSVLGVIKEKNQGVALVKDHKTNKLEALRPSMSLSGQPGLTLKEVHLRSVVFLSAGGGEYVVRVGSRLSPQSQPQPRGPVNAAKEYELRDQTFIVTERLKKHLLEEDLSNILNQAASEPYLVNGKLKGFRLWEIDEGSIYQKAGLEDGDTIIAINGRPLTSALEAVKQLKLIRSDNQAKFSFIRRGKEKTLSILVQ